ncbi:MAG: hypothetical protein KGP27_04540 [Hyphomicrobiales bacterium]|nr:hypothetical protein [Hyphomicrobiales bacterium]
MGVLESVAWRAETKGDRRLMNKMPVADFFQFARSHPVWARVATVTDGSSLIATEVSPAGHALQMQHDATALVTYNRAVRNETVEGARRTGIWSLIDG